MIETHSKSYEAKPVANMLQMPKTAPFSHDWSPYAENGGTVAAVAGKGFVIVAGDTRLNSNNAIVDRNDTSKICAITPKTLLASTGMQADRLQLQEQLKYKIEWYAFNNGGKVPSTFALSQLVSTILYSGRSFPLLTFNLIAGLDENGDGVCFSFDIVGSTEPRNYGVTGSSQTFMEPLMDCLIRRSNMVGQAPKDMTKDEALHLLKNAFTAAGERDIYTGDSVKFHILTADGLTVDTLPLRLD